MQVWITLILSTSQMEKLNFIPLSQLKIEFYPFIQKKHCGSTFKSDAVYSCPLGNDSFKCRLDKNNESGVSKLILISCGNKFYVWMSVVKLKNRPMLGVWKTPFMGPTLVTLHMSYFPGRLSVVTSFHTVQRNNWRQTDGCMSRSKWRGWNLMNRRIKLK